MINKEHLRVFLNSVTSMDQPIADIFLDHFEHRSFDKNQSILGNYGTKRLWFIEKGLVKMAFENDGREFVMRFFAEGEMLTILETMFMGKMSSSFYIETLEETETLSIGIAELEVLCAKHHVLETFLRKFTTGAAINMMKRIKEMLEDDATKRYNIFLSNNAKIVNRISLGDMAAYLGITQVSLSRIRAKD